MSAFHDYRASGARLATSFWLVLAADLAISAGQENTALYFVENALEFAQICHEGFYLSEIYRKRARLRSRLRLEGVESDLTRAIDISVAQGARLFELRCAEDMSKFTKDKAVREQLERRIAQLKGLMAK